MDKKFTFEDMVDIVRQGFQKYRNIEMSYRVEDEGTEDECQAASWNWTNSNGVDEMLELTYSPATGEMLYEDNGGVGDIELTKEDAEWLVKEYAMSDGNTEDKEEDDETETGKMRKLEEKLESLIDQLQDLADDIEDLDGEKLEQEWQEDEDDEGYSSDAPYEFAASIRYAIEQLEARYENL